MYINIISVTIFKDIINRLTEFHPNYVTETDYFHAVDIQPMSSRSLSKEISQNKIIWDCNNVIIISEIECKDRKTFDFILYYNNDNTHN